MRRFGACVLAVSVTLSTASSIGAQEQTPQASGNPETSSSLNVRTSLKASLLGSRAPDAPLLFPVQDSAAAYWRARLDTVWRSTTGVLVSGAYEHRLQVFNSARGLLGGGVVPPEVPAPYRIRQGDWALAQEPGLSWRHEIDRAFVAWPLSGATLTVGRQAVGWGRGVVFGAVDLFSPFSPLEADREWRRGVDAIRVEVPLSDHTSADGVVALGRSLDESAEVGRWRGYAGEVDVEIVGGRRARDWLGGVTSSAAVGPAGIHGELVIIRAQDGPDLPTTPVVKAVAGTSYRFDLGPGIVTFLEYHYSGFGAPRPEDILTQLSDPAFLVRVLRGDVQILGRHALTAIASSELSPEWTVGGQWLHAPNDGSGVISPSATLTVSDAVSLYFSGYLSYGRPPVGTTLQSEYGARGDAVFVQLRLYL